MMFKVLTLNSISVIGLERLSRERYEVASEIQNPDAVLLRSFNMHDWAIPASLKAVGRAGAGVNNIPVTTMSAKGIPVFNAPGANANAVKELVLASLFLTARNILDGWAYTRQLKGTDEALAKQVEAGKKQFVGYELAKRRLGVIGLGAIGVKVANAALALGMDVLGYDPEITVKNALQLSPHVKQALSIQEILAQAEFVTVHVPLTEKTRHIINAERLRCAYKGLKLFNFSREGVVDDSAVGAAIKEGQVGNYVCDFPTNQLLAQERVITLPHLGASTQEAEVNCAVMVADQIRDYLEHGTVHNAVNFPEMEMSRESEFRLLVVNSNVPHMIERISSVIAKAGLNINNMLNKSRGEIACTLVDVNCPITEPVVAEIKGITGVLTVRTLSA